VLMALIRVLVVDDHPLVRAGIQAILKGHPRIRVVAEAGDGEEGLRRARSEKPDIVLLDLAMPGITAQEFMAGMRRAAPSASVLVVSIYDDPESVREMALLGVKGYFVKGEPAAQLTAAIEAVSGGQPFFCASAAQNILAQSFDRPRRGDRPLSKRERQVLVLLSDGSSNKLIAEKLQLSVRTVEAYRANLMEKLGIFTIAGLTRYAIARGVIKLP
jgi:DNA-binding NarL/FixJ family response regulator